MNAPETTSSARKASMTSAQQGLDAAWRREKARRSRSDWLTRPIRSPTRWCTRTAQSGSGQDEAGGGADAGCTDEPRAAGDLGNDFERLVENRCRDVAGP